MKRKMRQDAAFLCLLTAAVCALLPVFLSAAVSLRREESIGSYEETVQAGGTERIETMRREAEAYNETIRREQEAAFFVYRGEKASDETYEKVLAVNGPIMVYLRIPSIGLSVPVLHGTGEAALSYAAGHMYGTSVPVGGDGCNAVIAGHTGLTARKIFDDLTDLSEGDLIDVHVLDETHRYAVTEIHIVSPAVEAAFFQTEEGRDLLTLYTCTPPGLNTHRLIVTAERTEDPPAEETRAGTVLRTAGIDPSALAKMMATGLVPVGMVVIWRRVRRKTAGS